MHCECLVLVSSVFVCACDCHASRQTAPPDLIIPMWDGDEKPQVDSKFTAGGTGPRQIPREATEFIRCIALLLIPREFEDDHGWGDEKKIQAGLNIRFDDGRIDTNRRWKQVNHGNWLQAHGKLVDPEERFQLNVSRLPEPEKGIQRYEVKVSARLRITGRQQQWSYGVMLWSISAEAIADATLHLVLDVKSEIVQDDQGTRLRFHPNVMTAEAQLTNFNLRRISHLKGKGVQEFGELLERRIAKRVRQENRNLAARINTSLENKSDHLEIPFDIAGWFYILDSAALTE